MRWRTVRTRVLVVTALATAVAIGVAIASMLGGAPAVLVLEPAATTLTADGSSTISIIARPAGRRRLPYDGATITIVEGARRAGIESGEATRDGARPGACRAAPRPGGPRGARKRLRPG